MRSAGFGHRCMATWAQGTANAAGLSRKKPVAGSFHPVCIVPVARRRAGVSDSAILLPTYRIKGRLQSGLARLMLNKGIWRKKLLFSLEVAIRTLAVSVFVVTAVPGQTVLNEAKKIADARKLFDTLAGNPSGCEVSPLKPRVIFWLHNFRRAMLSACPWLLSQNLGQRYRYCIDPYHSPRWERQPCSTSRM